MTWYEAADQYTETDWIGPGHAPDREIAGPRGIALVDVYAEGRTTPGWGPTPTDKHDGFMAEYMKGRFVARPRVRRFAEKAAPFAFVMRSVKMLVVDVDRHLGGTGADGFDGMRSTGFDWPETMAETSKSGDGRHLFYLAPDLWSDDRGYGAYEDAIGLFPGVDVRATGCVYHYPTQRWNSLELAAAPQGLLDALDLHNMRKTARNAAIAALGDDLDDTEALIMHDNLRTQLAAPIPEGKRNQTLYAIAKDMHASGYPDWETEIHKKGADIGLPEREVDRIVANASR